MNRIGATDLEVFPLCLGGGREGEHEMELPQSPETHGPLGPVRVS